MIKAAADNIPIAFRRNVSGTQLVLYGVGTIIGAGSML